MEKTDRELLIKEISSRLPYGIKAQVFGWDEEKGEVAIPLKVYSINTDGYISFEYNHYDVESIYIEDCHLYLRPMSSMTEEEKQEWYKQSHVDYDPEYKTDPTLSLDNCHLSVDWLNSHHFAYRTIDDKDMFELGLALEALEGMYK